VNQRYEKSQQYVGIDLHRRRSVLVRIDGQGEVLECVRLDNSVPALLEQVAKAGPPARLRRSTTGRHARLKREHRRHGPPRGRCLVAYRARPAIVIRCDNRRRRRHG